VYILDTSAILSGKIHGSGLAAPPGVVNEIKKGGRAWRMLEYLKAAGLKIISPPDYSINEIRKAAEKTGDAANLSEADIEVLALAHYLKATLLTDDYSIQNVAKEIGVEYKGMMEEGIKEKFQWKYRCKSCGRYYNKFLPSCPICGGEIKRVRR